MLKEIRKHNKEEFIQDLKKVRTVVVYASNTRDFFKITKVELIRTAHTTRVDYYLSDKVFRNKRTVMVII